MVETIRRRASLTKDDETNQAAWEAARGAVVGAAKVSYLSAICILFNFSLNLIVLSLTMIIFLVISLFSQT